MKNRLLHMLFALSGCIGFSQSTTLFVHADKPTNISPANGCIIGDYEYHYDLSHEMGIFPINDMEVLVSVDYREGYNDDPNNNCNGICGQFAWYCDDPNDMEEEVLQPFETLIVEYNGPDVIECGTEDCLPINYRAVLLPDIDPGDPERCSEQPLFEQYEDGQDHYVEGLRWKYLGLFGWEDIPNHTNRYPLNVSIEEIFGPDYESSFMGNLHLTYEVTAPFSNIVLESGVLFSFSLIGCSPGLEGINPISTTCPGADDGSFTMTVNRNLNEGEELVVAVYDVNFPDGGSLQQEPTTVLIDNGDTTYSYVFPYVLSSGNYFVKYQTHPTGEDIEDESWNSLEFSDPFEILPPPEVTFTLQKLNDVRCHDGSDGRIEIEATGGMGEGNYQYRVNNNGDWMDFSNTDNHILNGLSEGDYVVAVQRINGNATCAGQPNGPHQIHIDEPSEPLAVDDAVEFVEPTAYNFTDGSITVDVSGGTPYQNNSYNYTWRDVNNNIVNTTSAMYQNNVYRITLEDIAAGTYTLTIRDANYNQADDKGGCILIEEFELTGPPELQLQITETIPISCNSANNYNNASNDGQLTANASGGVPPYQYFWKKKDENNQWQLVPNENTAVLSNLEAGEYAVNVEDAHGIVIGTYVNNQLQQANDVVYALEEPELLTVQIEKTDINCFGGSDGTATALVSGGTPPYEFLWSTGATSETAEGLWLGNHSVYVVDSRGCEAEGEVIIGQPDAPVSIANPQYVQPTAYGFTNGSITVQVNGGTPYNNDSYNYEWRDEQNNIINTTSAQHTPDGYVIQAHDIPAGTYTITVTDANHENAVQKEGCTYVAEFILEEPPALELSVEQTIPISCNGGNQFNNPSDDGQLMAIATGGVPFDPLIDGQYAYIYTWKKKDEQNIWQIIPNVTGNVLDNVGAGEYAVNIEDANGIILGIYVNNILEEPTDYLYPVQETDPIVLQIEKMDVSCFDGNDGFASVSIDGGMPPYDISWSSGASGEIAENLTAGTYFVYVKDFYGCEVSGQIVIAQPEELKISIVDTVVPTCYDANNGSLTVEVLGGVAPYTYLWNTGESSLSLANLGEGVYTFEVMDAIGCTTTKEIVLEAPYPTQVDLGEDRTLCNGQEHSLDISVDDPAATYEWTSNNGFYSTSPQVNLSEAGIYTATVTNSLGCSGVDTIEIWTTQVDVDAQFLITSQAFAGEEVVLVNTSNPIGTNEEWVFPNGAEVVEQEKGMAILQFDVPGAYEVILRNYQDDCYQDVAKTIIVAEARELPDVGDAISPFIKDFKVYPNPSSGSFSVMVSLQEVSVVSLRLFGLTTNHIHDEKQLSGSLIYEVPYTVDLASGVYLLLLETAKGSEVRKIVIL